MISTVQTSSNIATITGSLADTPKRLEALNRRFSDERLRQPLGPGERSATAVLAHLIHAEHRSSEAIYLALLINEPLLADVHPERQWGKLLRYDLFEFSELVVYFNLRRTVLLRVLNSLTDMKWARTMHEEGKQRKESVYWRARSLVLHEREHLADMEGKLQLFPDSL
jgi:hypothetical protein